MSSETTKDFRYKCHGLFVYSRDDYCEEFLKISFNAIKYYGFFYQSLSRIMAHYSHVICAYNQNMPQNCLSRVNLQQITSLRGYIHPNEQAVLFMPQMLCPFAAH